MTNLIGATIALSGGFALAYWAVQFAKFMVRSKRK
jgi:hypothetical protein